MNSKILFVCLVATILIFGFEEVAAGKDKTTGGNGKSTGSKIAEQAKNTVKKAAGAVSDFAEGFAGA